MYVWLSAISVVSVTHCPIKMVNDTDNKRELEMRRTKPHLHLTDT